MPGRSSDQRFVRYDSDVKEEEQAIGKRVTFKKGINTDKNKRILFLVVIVLFMVAGIILAVCVCRKKTKKNIGLQNVMGKPPVPAFIEGGGGSGSPDCPWNDSVSKYLDLNK